MTRQFLVSQAEAAAFARDRGTGTVLPSTDLRRGDTYFHTGIDQLTVHDGTRWRLTGRGTVATAAERNALTWAHPGMRILVTATDATGGEFEFSGGTWKATSLPRVAFPFLNGWTNFDPAFAPAQVWAEGRTAYLTGLIKNPGAIATATNQQIGQVPTIYRPGPSQAGKALPTVQFYNGLSPLRFDVLSDGAILMNNATGPAIGANQFITLNMAWGLD